MFIASGGIPVLVRMLDKNYEDYKEIVLSVLDCIYDIFRFPVAHSLISEFSKPQPNVANELSWKTRPKGTFDKSQMTPSATSSTDLCSLVCPMSLIRITAKSLDPVMFFL